ncbi:MAG TPA: GSU2403 family nucleotidyltransferase fold protein [Thermoanaerobaculia bacterium]|nr:GSU2403 family nucleotidyltransferase fold protein [Thermoanaerobaculia bacterium]
MSIYAELLEEALVYERSAVAAGDLAGSVVEKEVHGRRYLYWQLRMGDRSVQRYIGSDSPALRADLERRSQRRGDLASDQEALARLAAMLLAAGLPREEVRVSAALRLLADLGLFRRGGVLVGTQAYRAYGPLLGHRLPAASLRTQDIDVALELSVAIAAAEEPAPALASELHGLGFLPIPGLDPSQPSTSFKIRGRELRVDFLTPATGRARERPVIVPGIGLAAWPLPLLDYLIEEPTPAVILASKPILVRLPRPARFALHKLWTAARRSVAEAAKSGKDRLQAAALIEILAADRPDDLVADWRALGRRSPRAQGRVARELARIPEDQRRAWPRPLRAIRRSAGSRV